MVYKNFQNNDISHICYPITKKRIIVSGSGIDGLQYDYFLTQYNNPSIYQLAGLQRYIYNNNTFIDYQDQFNAILKSLEGGHFPSQMFSVENGRIFLQTNSVKTILSIKHLNSMDPQNLIGLSIVQEGLDSLFYISNSIIYKDEECSSVAGIFLPNINMLLFTDNYPSNKWKIEIQYNFEIHEFEYMCNIKPGEFNRTLNITAYEKNEDNGQYCMLPNINNTYISSIGLYDDNNVLMAIAKLSSPIKISNIIDTTILINLDYIP